MNRRNLLNFSRGALVAGLAARASGDSTPAGLRIYDVREHGATGGGKVLDTAAINRTIDMCHDQGGGMVYLPPGTYLTGTVVLKSNVTLYLEAQATILGSRDLKDYTPAPGPPARGDANQKHLIFARDAENIAICGPGSIDGQGPSFWQPSGRIPPPPEESWRDVATYDWKAGDRPSPMIELVGCRNLRLEEVRIRNASGWTLRPINCDNVFLRGLHIQNPVIGPNTDGIDATGCHNLFISDCLIDTGDDAICLKSENPYGGEVRVSKNIAITNCVLTCCCNGLKFGTATQGGFENVVFTNSVIFNEAVDPKARVIAGIAVEMVDGGWVEGVVISNVRMQNVRTPVFVRRGIRRARPDGTPGTLRGVRIDNLHATGSILTSSVTGLPGFEAEDVALSNVLIESREGGQAEWAEREVPEVPQAYPEARMFGRLPSWGFYARHVKGLRLRGVELHAAGGDERPAVICDDAADLEISGLRVSGAVPSGPAGGPPAIRLTDTRSALISGCVAPAGAKAFLEVRGARSQSIALVASQLAGAQEPATVSHGAPAGAVKVS
ncbi:MAG: glycoside hydrolase family 28 protein [Bryobacteraceae bacterium]